MIIFNFNTDKESYEYCCEIVDAMIQLFQINKNEAIERVNSQWNEQNIIGETDSIHLEFPEDWAKIIYYTTDTEWWIPNTKLKIKKYNALTKEYE